MIKCFPIELRKKDCLEARNCSLVANKKLLKTHTSPTSFRTNTQAQQKKVIDLYDIELLPMNYGENDSTKEADEEREVDKFKLDFVANADQFIT